MFFLLHFFLLLSRDTGSVEVELVGGTEVHRKQSFVITVAGIKFNYGTVGALHGGWSHQSGKGRCR